MADATNPWGTLGNGALFLPPVFGNMTGTGFAYGSLADQMKDASQAWAKGAGVFAGNNVPWMNGLAGSDPNGTFGGGITTMKPNVGGGLLGMTAYSGGFNPFAGRGNTSGTTNPGTTNPGTTNPGTTNSGTTNPTDPSTRTPSTGGTVPTQAGTTPGTTQPGNNLLRPPRVVDNFPGATTTSPTQPKTTTQGGGLLAPTGVPFPNTAQNWQAPSNPQQQAIYYAQSLNPADASKLVGLVGETQAHQYANQYGPGGINSDPNAIMDQYRAGNGGSQGIDTLMPAIRQIYEQNGVIVNGKWAKKLDNNGQWVSI